MKRILMLHHGWFYSYEQDGTDEVTVEVMRTREGKTESLGNASAKIIIDQNRSVYGGSWGVEQTDAGNGRACALAYIYVPKSEGAIKYEMHAYHFNDPLYFGKEYDRTFSGPQTDHGGKSTAIEDMGSVWRIGLSGGCGPADKV